MIFSYNWLQDYIKEKLPDSKKLAELFAEHFTEVEEVKKVGSDFSLDIGVKPNRAGDCFSHWGIAREVAAIGNWQLTVENYAVKEDKNKMLGRLEKRKEMLTEMLKGVDKSSLELKG